jgi:hypothetical protein
MIKDPQRCRRALNFMWRRSSKDEPVRISHKLVHTGRHYDVMMSKVFSTIRIPRMSTRRWARESCSADRRIMTRFVGGSRGAPDASLSTAM